jgi:PTS system ascorbate-specific IIA component
MIGVLIIAHEDFGASLIRCVCHVLGSRPQQLEALAVGANDDPLDLLPRARELVKTLDDGDGVLVVSDLFGATPCNLACKLLKPGHVEVVAGASLPMLVRTLTYRNKGLETMVKKAVSGGCEGVVHIEADPVYATARS